MHPSPAQLGAAGHVERTVVGEPALPAVDSEGRRSFPQGAARNVPKPGSLEGGNHGVAQIVETWQGWARAIPDSKATFVAEYASGDTAVLEVIWRGVHTGPLQMPSGTIPASNKRIEVPACQVVKVEGGKVQSFSHYFDMVTLLTQIGAFKG